MFKITFFLIFSFVLLSIITADSMNEQCMTPSNELSTCVPLTTCEPLYSLILKIDLTTSERTLLSKSQCGYRDKQVLVCCPPVPVGFGVNSNINQNSNLPRFPKCGVSLNNRIVGGNETAIDEYPWLALIEYTKPGNTKGHHCGGTLINDRYVLTAAHCVLAVPSSWQLTGVRLGEWNLNTNPDCEYDVKGQKDCAPEYIDVRVEETIPHPQYSPRTRNQENDIALLRLARKISFNDFIKPVCLPLDPTLRRSRFSGRDMDVAGWGRTEYSETSSIKLKATVSVWDQEKCKQKYTSQRIVLQSTQMCAGGITGIDSCKGDSGGPLVIEETVNRKSAYFLVGVVSFGPNPCGLVGWPGVYTRVGDFIDFIEYNVKA